MLSFEDRPSDSPFIERVWTSRSSMAGEFLSIASPRCELVVSRVEGRSYMTLRGPETRMTTAACPANGEWIGIRLKVGSFLPRFPPSALLNRRDVTLPSAAARSFWLNGSAWEYPSFENAETFIARLAARGLLHRDDVVSAALDGEPTVPSRRSLQRHFARATGITPLAFRVIERARHATNLLLQGQPIVGVAHDAGYFDQPHLTRSLTSLIGQTPGDIARRTRQLAYLHPTHL
jgi:hypothetical protein